jgi:hypothetical protein
MRHARGQKLQSFRRKWPSYMDLYSMSACLKVLVPVKDMLNESERYRSHAGLFGTQQDVEINDNSSLVQCAVAEVNETTSTNVDWLKILDVLCIYR